LSRSEVTRSQRSEIEVRKRSAIVVNRPAIVPYTTRAEEGSTGTPLVRNDLFENVAHNH